jgi:hypothetical protein
LKDFWQVNNPLNHAAQIQISEKGIKEVFPQRRYKIDHRAREKLLNITNHWGNASQNHSDTSSHAVGYLPLNPGGNK